MATAGPNLAGTGADDSTLGTVVWNNPGNITANDGSCSECGSVMYTGETHYLKATNFGFSIPSGATINGITVVINRASTLIIVQDRTLKIIKGGSFVGSNLWSAAYWPPTLTSKTYGSSSELWGTSWSYADINASDFGVGLTVASGSFKSAGRGKVDYIEITIDYTVGGASFIAKSNTRTGQAINRASTF